MSPGQAQKNAEVKDDPKRQAYAADRGTVADADQHEEDGVDGDHYDNQDVREVPIHVDDESCHLCTSYSADDY